MRAPKCADALPLITRTPGSKTFTAPGKATYQTLRSNGLRTVIASRPKRNGKKRLGTGWPAITFLGQAWVARFKAISVETKPIILKATIHFVMAVPPRRLSAITMAAKPRADLIWQMAMAFTIWLGTFGSGFGIGMTAVGTEGMKRA